MGVINEIMISESGESRSLYSKISSDLTIAKKCLSFD